MPKISVIMSVYSGERHLREAVDSILNQTASDLEFIVIDDASQDGTSRILDSYSDSRFKVHRNSENLGLTRSLNQALDLASGEYIARMDADDISLPDRLARQIAFLDSHPDIGVVGTALRRISIRGTKIGGVVRKPLSDTAIRWACLLENPIAHPSVMMRHSVLTEHGLRYDPSFQTSQDYELWVRMLQVCKAANLPEPLLYYRVHFNTVSLAHRSMQQEYSAKISFNAIASILPEFRANLSQVRPLQQILFGEARLRPMADVDRAELAHFLLRMFEAFGSGHATSQEVAVLRKKVALQIAHLVLLPPIPKGWRPVIAAAFRLYPGLAWGFPAYLTDLVVRETGRRIIYRVGPQRV